LTDETSMLDAVATDIKDPKGLESFLTGIRKLRGGWLKLELVELRQILLLLIVQIDMFGGHIDIRIDKNSHLPVRRRERKMQKFKSSGSAQRFLNIHSATYNIFTPNVT